MMRIKLRKNSNIGPTCKLRAGFPWACLSSRERTRHEGGVKPLPGGVLDEVPAEPLVEARSSDRVEEDPFKAAQARLLFDRTHQHRSGPTPAVLGHDEQSCKPGRDLMIGLDL